MKIEFLFRGLDCFGNWHLGSLITDNKTYWFIQTTLFKVSVDPESVGQYTNMIDKNGVKIFQGDIVIAYCAPSGSDRSKIKNRKSKHFMLCIFPVPFYVSSIYPE